MLPEGILFSTQTPPKAPTTPDGEKSVFLHPHGSYQKSNKIRPKLSLEKQIKKIAKISIFKPFWPPKPFPKPVQNHAK